MALSSNLYAFKVETLENILAQAAAPKVFRIAKLWEFLRGHSELRIV